LAQGDRVELRIKDIRTEVFLNEGATRNASLFAKASIVFAAWHDPFARILNVDLLAVAIAILLPWSTSGVIIFVALWIIALIPTLEPRAFLRLLRRPIYLTPIALFVLALAGTLWSDASWGARLHAVGPTTKLLVLPLLLYHFERTARGVWILVAFLGSSTLLMLASWVTGFVPTLTFKWYMEPGIVVKNHIDQSHVFALCAVALAWPIALLVRAKKFPAAGLLVVCALGFATNMVFVNLSRTMLIAVPIIVGIVVLHQKSWRHVIGALGALAILGALSWSVSPVLRVKTASLFPPYRLYEPANEPTSIAIRYEYWRKSIEFIREAPLIGHGTGSIRQLFEQAAVNRTGAAPEVTSNPHNQTLSVAIQWGIAGVLALYAMWLSHIALFWSAGWSSWIGFLVVTQNIMSSLFNSHLFDFQEGWIYVLGVGVAGGMALRDQALRTVPHAVSG
jgi:O-antigen ligase